MKPCAPVPVRIVKAVVRPRERDVEGRTPAAQRDGVRQCRERSLGKARREAQPLALEPGARLLEPADRCGMIDHDTVLGEEEDRPLAQHGKTILGEEGEVRPHRRRSHRRERAMAATPGRRPLARRAAARAGSTAPGRRLPRIGSRRSISKSPAGEGLSDTMCTRCCRQMREIAAVSRSGARTIQHALDQLAAKGAINKAAEDFIVESKGGEKCSGSTSLHSRQRLRFP